MAKKANRPHSRKSAQRRAKPPSATAPRDGSSFERAILVDQNRWRSQHCPGAELLLQLLQHDGDRDFDVLLLECHVGRGSPVCTSMSRRLFTAGHGVPDAAGRPVGGAFDRRRRRRRRSSVNGSPVSCGGGAEARRG